MAPSESTSASVSRIVVSPVPSANRIVLPWWRTTCPAASASNTVSVNSGAAVSSTWKPSVVVTITFRPSPTGFTLVNSSLSYSSTTSRVSASRTSTLSVIDTARRSPAATSAAAPPDPEGVRGVVCGIGRAAGGEHRDGRDGGEGCARAPAWVRRHVSVSFQVRPHRVRPWAMRSVLTRIMSR